MQAINGFFNVIHAILGFYEWIVIAAVIFSWLFTFNILNYSNGAVRMISDVVYRLTEPVLCYIRRLLPPLGGLDLSPIVLLFAIMFIRQVVVEGLREATLRALF